MAPVLPRIQITYGELMKRVKTLPKLVSSISGEKWVNGVPISSTERIKLSLQNPSSIYLKTKFPNFTVSYYEVWWNTKRGRGSDEVWSLDSVRFVLFKKNAALETYEEILALDCWESFKPDATVKLSNPIGFQKQKKQEKYQRSIHLHLKFLPPGPYQLISKSHLAITLGRDTYEFDSIDSLSRAMDQAIRLFEEEILDKLS